jgi:hypothetical protein
MTNTLAYSVGLAMPTKKLLFHRFLVVRNFFFDRFPLFVVVAVDVGVGVVVVDVGSVVFDVFVVTPLVFK